MNEVIPAYEAPILDSFIIKELTPNVVFVYYDKDETPLYVGSSKNFYDAHYWHLQKDEFADEIEYVGLRFYDDPAEIDTARRYWMKQLQPKFNKRPDRLKDPAYQDKTDELIVREIEMVYFWETSELYALLELCGMQPHKDLRKRNWGVAEMFTEDPWPCNIDGWEQEVGKEVPVDPLEPWRGRETVAHFLANLPQLTREYALECKWHEMPATTQQLHKLQFMFWAEGYELVRTDFTYLEAEMLFAWCDDFENLAKKPRFDLDYVAGRTRDVKSGIWRTGTADRIVPEERIKYERRK